MKFTFTIFLLLTCIYTYSQRSFYKINEVCDLDYDREDIVKKCYKVDEVQITRDLNNNQFIFFQNGEKFKIQFNRVSDDSIGIFYYYYNTLLIGLKFKPNTRIPYSITLVDESNNVGRRYIIESWKKE